MDLSGTDRYGCLRFSGDGSKLCYVLGGTATGETVQLCNYDNVTGIMLVVGNLATGGEIPDAYSAEFSADNTKLYVTGKDGDFIYQYDLSLSTFAAIKASRVNIANGPGMKCGLLRGPDGRIYVSRDGQEYLGVIDDPNQAGIACGYVNDGVYLDGRTCTKALPNYLYQEFPNPQLGPDQSICSGVNLILDAALGRGYTYLWQDGSTSDHFTVTQPGQYWVEVTKNGCQKRDTINVTAIPGFTVDLGPDTMICGTSNLLLDATVPGAGVTYTWQNGSTQPVYPVTTPGTYSVNVTAACGTASDTVVVQFKNCNCYIHVPNAFSPNYDFYNNTFKPVIGKCQFAAYNMKIVNRWGQKIYETNDPFTGWDGSFKGNLCDIGAYVYIISYRFTNEAETKVLRGTFMLIR